MAGFTVKAETPASRLPRSRAFRDPLGEAGFAGIQSIKTFDAADRASRAAERVIAAGFVSVLAPVPVRMNATQLRLEHCAPGHLHP